jgi:hypothetical protein
MFTEKTKCKLAATELPTTNFYGKEIPDPLSMILAKEQAEDREIALRAWIRAEFHLPKSLRALCDQSFLRVLSHAQFAVATQRNNCTIQLGERNYALHYQSTEAVLANAPLIAVSFRCFEGELFAVAHTWAAPKSSHTGV